MGELAVWSAEEGSGDNIFDLVELQRSGLPQCRIEEWIFDEEVSVKQLSGE